MQRARGRRKLKTRAGRNSMMRDSAGMELHRLPERGITIPIQDLNYSQGLGLDGGGNRST